MCVRVLVPIPQEQGCQQMHRAPAGLLAHPAGLELRESRFDLGLTAGKEALWEEEGPRMQAVSGRL